MTPPRRRGPRRRPLSLAFEAVLRRNRSLTNAEAFAEAFAKVGEGSLSRQQQKRIRREIEKRPHRMPDPHEHPPKWTDNLALGTQLANFPREKITFCPPVPAVSNDVMSALSDLVLRDTERDRKQRAERKRVVQFNRQNARKLDLLYEITPARVPANDDAPTTPDEIVGIDAAADYVCERLGVKVSSAQIRNSEQMKFSWRCGLRVYKTASLRGFANQLRARRTNGPEGVAGEDKIGVGGDPAAVNETSTRK